MGKPVVYRSGGAARTGVYVQVRFPGLGTLIFTDSTFPRKTFPRQEMIR